jgi:hypothetical protein
MRLRASICNFCSTVVQPGARAGGRRCISPHAPVSIKSRSVESAGMKSAGTATEKQR